MPHDFSAALRVIRARQRRMGWLLVGLVPFAIAAGLLPPGSEAAFIAAAIAYGAIVFAYSLRLAFTECPRCEALYHWSWWADPWTKRCLHCGLRLDA